MIKHVLSLRLGLKLAVLALLVLPDLAGAQFQYNKVGDVLSGFRKTGSADTTDNEMVSDFGNVTNFIALPSGASITITNFTAAQLTYAFGNNNNLQWSVFSTFLATGHGNPWVTPFGSFPNDTMWLTLPSTNVASQTIPPTRSSNLTQANQVSPILTVGGNAVSVSSFSSEAYYNTNTVVVESETLYPSYDLTTQIGDPQNSAYGDFGGDNVPLSYTVENTTPATFAASQRDDFYQLVPSGETDPITSSSGTDPYFIGFFLLYPNGSMTFTRGFSVIASANSGSAPLKAAFSTTATNSTGGITNWVWNFGNGTIVTNTTGANVTNTFTTAGTYTVTLTTYGPGGSGSVTTSIVVTSSAQPLLSIAASAGQFVINGTDGPASQQYRIFTTTNLTTSLANWTPIYTNTFSSSGTFSYTNATGGSKAFFILTSP